MGNQVCCDTNDTDNQVSNLDIIRVSQGKKGTKEDA